MKWLKEVLLILALCAVLGVYLKPTSLPPTEEAPTNRPVVVTENLGKGKYRLVLVQLDEDPKLVQWCQKQIEEHTGAEISGVVNISSESVMADCYDATRGKFDANQIAAFVDSMPHRPDERLLAVTDFDLYLSSQSRASDCFGTQGESLAVLSSMRMESEFHPDEGLFPTERSEHRFRKLVLRSALLLSYELPTNNRPESLLFRRVAIVGDLDNMNYEI